MHVEISLAGVDCHEDGNVTVRINVTDLERETKLQMSFSFAERIESLDHVVELARQQLERFANALLQAAHDPLL